MELFFKLQSIGILFVAPLHTKIALSFTAFMDVRIFRNVMSMLTKQKLCRYGRGQSPFIIPARILNPYPDSVIGKVKFIAPQFQRFFNSFQSGIDRVSFIKSLYIIGRPAHITRLIIAINIYTIYGVLTGRASSHAFVERFKTVLPFFTHRNASAAVKLVLDRIRVQTPRLHMTPYTVFGRIRKTMRRSRCSVLFIKSTHTFVAAPTVRLVEFSPTNVKGLTTFLADKVFSTLHTKTLAYSTTVLCFISSIRMNNKLLGAYRTNFIYSSAFWFFHNLSISYDTNN